MMLERIETIDDDNLIVPGTPAWNWAVAQGRGTKESLQWTQGDWANRICPIGERYEKTGAYANLQKYADELGIELKTLINYREVSGVFSDTRRRVSLSFGVHHALVKYPYLIDKMPKTVREARQLVKDEDARLTAEAKVRAEEEAARNAEELIRLAEEQSIREEEERAEELRACQAHEEAVLYSLLSSSISKLTEADRTFTKIRDHNPALTTRVNGYVQQLEDLLLIFKTSVNSNVDEALSNLFREES